jgi:hypothetical protein
MRVIRLTEGCEDGRAAGQSAQVGSLSHCVDRSGNNRQLGCREDDVELSRRQETTETRGWWRDQTYSTALVRRTQVTLR